MWKLRLEQVSPPSCAQPLTLTIANISIYDGATRTLSNTSPVTVCLADSFNTANASASPSTSAVANVDVDKLPSSFSEATTKELRNQCDAIDEHNYLVAN